MYVCVDDGHIIVWRALAFHVHLYFVSAVCMVMPQLVGLYGAYYGDGRLGADGRIPTIIYQHDPSPIDRRPT